MAASQVETLTEFVKTESVMAEKVFGSYIKCCDYFTRENSICVTYIAFSYIGASLGITSDGFFQLEELPR